MMEQVEFSHSLVSGMTYLVSEARNHGDEKMARILGNCLRHICLTLDIDADGGEGYPLSDDPDVEHAINFLTMYASIRDEQLKEDIVERLEGLEHRCELDCQGMPAKTLCQ